MFKLSHLRFSLKRMHFNSMLTVHRHLPGLFMMMLKIAVVLWIFIIIGMWFVWFPKPEDVADSGLIAVPEDVPLSIINESPFSDLREPAKRPVPSEPVISDLKLAP